MKKIILKSLTLENFKGIKELTIDFKEDITNIHGDNGTGKTSIFDAYSWLLFGKDSSNNTTFNIKTISEDGSIPTVDHTVIATFEIDGKEVTFQKTYKELWTKKRGSSESVFSGHTTDYYINTVPIKEKDYKDRIATIIDEETFKLISNPRYFSVDLHKNTRREILMAIADEVTNEDIMKVNPDLKELDLENYSILEIQTMNKATLDKANNELKELPVRIDELNNSLQEYDWEAMEFNKKATLSSMDEIDKQLAKGDNTENLKNINEKILHLNQEKYGLISEIDKLNNDKKTEITSLNNKVLEEQEKAKNDLKKIEKERDDLANERITKENLLAEYREEYNNIAKESYQGDSTCPTCGQSLPSNQIEEALNKFNINKSNKLSSIVNTAELLKKDLEKINLNIENLTKKVEEINVKTDEPIKIIEFIPETYPERVKVIDEEITNLREELNNYDVTDNRDLIERKATLQNELQVINSKLAYKEINEQTIEKIKAYESRQKELAEIYSQAQKILFLCDQYNQIKAELISTDIANKFEYVEFKLFETQINGGLKEVCEATVKGVPYGDVNNAGKINAGLDIINTLSGHYKVLAPIFIDNAESVNKLIDTDSQVVRLVVSKDKELKVK